MARILIIVRIASHAARKDDGLSCNFQKAGYIQMLSSLFREFKNILIFDVETTGFNPKIEEIIEIAMLKVSDDNGSAHISEQYGELVRLSENRRLPAKITELTGITEKQLQEEGLPKKDVCDKISDMLSCETPLVIAYNAQFDLCFLYYFLYQFGKADLLKNVKMLDAMTVFKDRRPYPHKLIDAATAYGLSLENAHRALDDTRVTFEILCEMAKETDDLQKYINLFGYNPKYGVSGVKISSVKYKPQGFDAAAKLYES